MYQYPVMYFLRHFGESFIDNVVRDTVKPIPGSVIYCDLAFSTAEHTASYVV